MAASVLRCSHLNRALCVFKKMKMISKLSLSFFILCPYLFLIVWLLTINESGVSEPLRGASRLVFFFSALLAVTSLWVFTWFRLHRTHATKGLWVSLALSLIFVFLGYPKSIGIVALALPLIVFSMCCVIYHWHSGRKT